MERLLLSLVIGAALVALLQKNKEYSRFTDSEKLGLAEGITKNITRDVTKSVGAQFQEIRVFHQLSAAELARKIGLSEANIVSIEADRAVPSRDILFAMEDTFHCTIRTDIKMQP